jgi:hypothetical protein
MSDDERTTTILIREGTLLPPGVSVETQQFLPGWRMLVNRDRNTFTRQVERANWTFFFLAGEIRATVLGRDKLRALRRAAKSVLAKRERQIPNCLEITKVVSQRFLGIPFISVTAHDRHIQESPFLVPPKDSLFRLRPSSLRPVEVEGPDTAVTKGYEALFSNS